MADTVITNDIIAREALLILDNQLGFIDSFHRAHESEYSNTTNGYKRGATVPIRRPADFTVRTGAVASNQDVIEGEVSLTVNQQIGVDFNFTSSDRTLNVSEFNERFTKPAITNICNEMARDCLEQMYQGTYNWVGTPGQTINSFADFAKGPERLDEMAVPSDMRYATMSTADTWAMVGAQTELNAADKLASKAYTMGEIGMIGDCTTFKTQVSPTHVVGDHAGTPLVDGATQEVTYDTAKNTWTQTLITDGWNTSADLLAGDVFTIANVFMVNSKTKASTGILQQFVLTADVTTNASAAADTNLTISPPIIISGPHQTVNATPANNAAITMLGTANASYKQNLFYHKNAFAVAVVPMEMPQGVTDGVRVSKNGLSIRLQPYYDGANDVGNYRFDLLYGRRLIDPRLVTRGSGTA